MKKLILETQISIDGFIADSNGNTDWMIWNWGPDWNWDKELQLYHTHLNKSVKAIIISSQMAQEGFNLHWQKVTENANDPRYDFAKHINDTPKYVVTKTLTKDKEIPGGWSNSEILNKDLVLEIAELKNKVNGDLIVYGGATLVSNLVSADLIDEYHLITNPVVLGNGLAIFRHKKTLKLIKSDSYKCGVTVTQYEKENS